MNKTNKILIVCLIASWLIAGTLIINEFVPIIKTPRILANVYLIPERAGIVDVVSEQHNIITDIGERYMRNVWGFNNITNYNATKWISVGNNSAVSAGDTKLDSELTTCNGSRQLAYQITALNIGGDYAVNFTAKFFFTGTCRWNATSIHHNPTSDSDGNTVALSILTEYTWNNHDNATIIWSFIFNAN